MGLVDNVEGAQAEEVTSAGVSQEVGSGWTSNASAIPQTSRSHPTEGGPHSLQNPGRSPWITGSAQRNRRASTAATDSLQLGGDLELVARQRKGALSRQPPQPTGVWRVSKEYARVRDYAHLKPNDEIRQLVDQIRIFAQEYQDSTTDSYWHRKSGKVVLCVLMIRNDKGKVVFVRGINSELSLPSGSICAERAAISNALSQYIGIFRTDFVAIAVVAPQEDELNPIAPYCPWIEKSSNWRSTPV